MADYQEPLDLNYSPELFVQMMEFLREKMSNFAPLTSHFGGYTYVFKTQTDKINFDRLVDTNEEQAMSYVFDKWKEGVENTMKVDLTSGYNNSVLMGQKNIAIEFTFTTDNGDEPVTVNYTFSCKGIRQSVQEIYAAREEVRFVIDNYLLEGTNYITIQVRGNESKVARTVSVQYTMSELSVSSNFNISNEYGSGDDMGFNVVAKGASDTRELFVEYVLDGNFYRSEYKVSSDRIGEEERIAIDSAFLPTTPGKHTLQLRTRATIGGINHYSKVWYYEWIRTGYSGQIVTIKRELVDNNFLSGPSSLTIMCEQYVPEVITYGFRSSNSNKYEVKWQLQPVGGGDATNVGAADVGGDVAGNEGTEFQMAFMPVDSGLFRLVPTVNGEVKSTYDVQVVQNTSGLEEASVSNLVCRLFSLGRLNEEPSEDRSVWKYKTVGTTFTDVRWNGVSGWVDNALQLAEGAKAVIDVQPFINMSAQSNGMTVEIDFETFNAVDEDAVVLSVGDRIKVTANTASLTAPTSRTVITDKFPTNRRVTLAFVVHSKTSLSQPMLMEIINTGVTSRCSGYQSADIFTANDKITIGGTDKCGIRVYGVRVYTSISLTNKQELNNVIVSADDIAGMVRRNDIYKGTEVDIEKIRNRIPCLWITGHGGTDVLSTIWNSQAKQQIHVDAEWTNPNDGGLTNWRCLDMRLRSHGQSTLRNPMKSLKMWFKNESAQNTHFTQFFNRDEDAPVEDPRWAMKTGAMPQNKFVAQCYYIDSSNCKSPALLNVIDETMRGAGIFTPPMSFAINEYPKRMKEMYGEDPDGNGWKFPYNIRYTPDSIPCVIIARDTDSEAWHFEGIFVLMDDKKSDYLYGERSIYSCPGDPFCFYHNKADYETLWDNSGVTRFEYLSNTHPLSIDALKGVEDYYKAPQTFVPDDDEQDVITTPDGGETSGGTESDATYDFEQALELIYPDIDDLKGKKSWPTNYADPADLTNDNPHANRLYQFKAWVAECRRAQEGGDGYAKFRNEAALHIDIDQWAAYYCFAMPNGTFDNIVRNLQLTTFGKVGDYYVWLPLWWDIDIQDGTINTGQLAFDPPVDRQTETSNYGVAFRGQESWFWNALEAWPAFKASCRNIMNRLNNANYTYEKVIAEQDGYCDTWPEAMYNESQNVKYKKMYLSNPASNARYLYYLLGDGRVFRRWWLKKNWDYWMSYLAAGDAVKNGVVFRWNGGSFTGTVTFADNSFFLWAWGDEQSHGTSLVVQGSGYSTPVKRGDTKTVYLANTSNSQYATIYSAAYILKMDFSNNAHMLLNVDLSFFNDPNGVGTMLEELNIGVSEAGLRSGLRNGASGIFAGWGALTKLRKLNLQGYTAGESLDLSASSQLTHLYARGSAYSTIKFANSLDLQVAELPSSLTILDMQNITFGDVKFYEENDPYGSSFPFPKSLTNARFMGMGDQDPVHVLIRAWMGYNTGKEANLSLEITNINWQSCSYEEIMQLGKIPASKRRLQGKVKITTIGGTDRNLTNDEMNALSTAFNDPDKGINVFSTESTFQIDLKAGVILSGPSEIWAGNSGQIIGAVFPLTAGGYSFRYEIKSINGGSLPSGVNEVLGVQTYHNIRLYVTTGIIETTETNDPDCTLDIECVARSTTSTMDAKMFRVTIRKRIYPTLLTINGNEIIQSTGQYPYTIIYEPQGINGTFFKHQWVLTGGNEQIRLVSNAKGNAQLYIGEITDDADVTIDYSEEYITHYKISAAPVNVSIVYAAAEAILFDIYNHEVFDIFNTYGQTNPDYVLSNPAQMTRVEARRYTALPPAFNDASVASKVTHFEEIRYFRNLTGTVDLTKTGLKGDVSFGQLDKVTTLNVSGLANVNSMDISQMHGLVNLDISNMSTSLDIYADNDKVLSIVGTKSASVFVSDSKAEETRKKSDAMAVEYASDYGEVFLEWPDGTRVRYANERLVSINNQ